MKERNINVEEKHWTIASHTQPNLGMCPENQTHNFLVYRLMLQPTKPPTQGKRWWPLSCANSAAEILCIHMGWAGISHGGSTHGTCGYYSPRMFRTRTMGKSPSPDGLGSTSNLRRVIRGRICELRETLRVLPPSSLTPLNSWKHKCIRQVLADSASWMKSFHFLCVSLFISSHYNIAIPKQDETTKGTDV